MDSETRAGQHSYRVTQVEDAMLFRACAIDLRGRDAAAIERACSLAAELLELTLPSLAHVIESAFDEQTQTLWLIYEHISGTEVGTLLREVDSRLGQARWLAALVASLGELLADLHARGLTGLDLPPDQIGLRGRSSARAKSGPPRLSMLEIPLHALRGLPPGNADDDLRELGLLIVRMLDAEGGSREATLDLVESGRWRELPGLDSGLQLLLEQLLSKDLSMTSEELRSETQRLGASLRETRREPTPLRIVRTPAASPQPPRGPPAAVITPRAGPGPLPLSRESVRGRRPAGDDVPVMRPEDLSRELSQAHRATAAIDARERKSMGTSWALLVIIVAVLTALLTYLGLHL